LWEKENFTGSSACSHDIRIWGFSHFGELANEIIGFSLGFFGELLRISIGWSYVKSYFVTGTDTGVGKTAITASLAWSLRDRGIDVGIMKPIASGKERKARFKSEDVELLCEAAKVGDDESEINPVFLPLPVSPYDASKTLKTEIDMEQVLKKFELLRKRHQMLLVEGIGGIMTPIRRDYFVANMIVEMGLEAIIVTRSALGTLNHTMMTVEACRKYGIPVKGLVINYYDEKGGPEEGSAPATLHEITGLKILGVIPRVNYSQRPDMMADIVGKNIDLNSLIS